MDTFNDGVIQIQLKTTSKHPKAQQHIFIGFLFWFVLQLGGESRILSTDQQGATPPVANIHV